MSLLKKKQIVPQNNITRVLRLYYATIYISYLLTNYFIYFYQLFGVTGL